MRIGKPFQTHFFVNFCKYKFPILGRFAHFRANNEGNNKTIFSFCFWKRFSVRTFFVRTKSSLKFGDKLVVPLKVPQIPQVDCFTV